MARYAALNPASPGTRIRFSASRGRYPGPHYEFFCHACKKIFSRILSVAEHDKERIACPHCGSKNVEQRWTASPAITATKSA
ncbi:MAG TPA: FmdB family zinc ribbon protein [Terriglobales bacterium]|nr:FmdB family zinc ribbon protein [Terriglobales bacterium]